MSVTPETYTVVEHLHTGAVFELVRGVDDRDGSPVVLKRLDADRRSEAEEDRLRREFAILRGLDVTGVVRARGLHDAGGTLSLVLEDAGGGTLASFLERVRPELRTFLDIAIQLAEILGQVHSRQVIHKDIKPRNILLDGELRVQLIDFGIAVRLPREIAAVNNPSVLQGTLAYIAPEQTGRMNRAVDHRSDLYALGVTFYEMLTGAPPFTMRDPIELIHAHIARRPLPPHELEPAIPPVLSDIVIKLLAKTAEGRYRSAFGLRADLERCRDNLQAGAIDRFPLAERDVASTFQIPEALYGREDEVAELEAALVRVRDGASELVLVQGPAGAGKSTVIAELQRSLAGGRGFFVTGRFDPLRRDQPYSAVRDALGGIVRHLLAETEQNVARWRWSIERALGGVSDALVSLLPDMALVLGPQPPLPDLSPAAARARFHRAITSFCRCFARPRSPLVLVLDDLQWADSASLDLLVALLAEPEAGGMMVIGSFRDAEVGAAHPLHAALTAIAAASCPITRIDLGPLDLASITQLVADTLDLAADEVAPLAALVEHKTGGNGFFAAEFLRDLHDHGLLEFDPGRLRWTWDLARITDAPATDNVVDLMIERTRGLEPGTRALLQLAACIGNDFGRERLAALAGQPRAEVEAALAGAVTAGMLLAIGDDYRFAHDRVQ
ncbi:MAG: AAA family ATPase, partial [Nannocystis sp.]|nr:AAA family ATPase [Nannocystis sp.]